MVWTTTLGRARFGGGRSVSRGGGRGSNPGEDRATAVDAGSRAADDWPGIVAGRYAGAGASPHWRSVVHANRRLVHRIRSNGPLGVTSRVTNGPPAPAPRAGRSVGVDQLAHSGDLAPKLVVGRRLAVDLVAGVEDRGVVPPAELGTDPQERHVGLFAHQVHRDLAGHDDRPVALLALERLHRHAVVVGHDPGDPLWGHLALLGVVDDVGQDRLGQLDADRGGAHAGIGHDPVERPLELADVADYLAGDELD